MNDWRSAAAHGDNGARVDSVISGHHGPPTAGTAPSLTSPTANPLEVRTGGAPWGVPVPDVQEFARHAAPDQPLTADVLVVGAGITGALMAQRLSASGLRVVIVDRQHPASGSTAASTALLQFELDLPLHELQERLGTEHANRAWQRSALAVQSLARLIREERFHCGYRPRTSLYLSGDLYDGAAMRREIAARHSAGLPGELLDRSAIREAYQLDREAAIATAGAAAVNPVKLTSAVLALARSAGAELWCGMEVQSIQEGEDEVRAEVVDAHGESHVVEASAAVYCTGYQVPPLVGWSDHDIVSTWSIAATAVPAPPDWVRTHVVWEGSDPYLYMRSLSPTQVIIGGRDEPSAIVFRDRDVLQSKAAELLAQLRGLLPSHQFRLSHAWAGAFGSSSTGLPFIGRLPGYERVFSVHGFGGNGITHSMLAADLVTAELQGRPDPDAALFNGSAAADVRRVPARVPLGNAAFA